MMFAMFPETSGRVQDKIMVNPGILGKTPVNPRILGKVPVNPGILGKVPVTPAKSQTNFRNSV